MSSWVGTTGSVCVICVYMFMCVHAYVAENVCISIHVEAEINTGHLPRWLFIFLSETGWLTEPRAH